MAKIKKEYQPYTLGLDIGIASAGAALLGETRILGMHVRTFDRAETAKEGESLNKIRRESRGVRKRIRRRAQRLKRLRFLFKRAGLTESTKVSEFELNTPWELRKEGLDRQLNSREWAVVIYHIVKHRGFQSTRKSEAQSDEKVGQMLTGVNQNQQMLKESGYRTLGELAACHIDFSSAKRNKGGSYINTFARPGLESELGILFSAQREFDNPFSNEDFERDVHEILMQRRPAIAGDDLLKMLGHCRFEPAEYRAPKASHSAEQFVWLTRLNNLRINHLGEIRALNDDEREMLINFPFEKTKLTYQQVRKVLDLPSLARFVGLSYPREIDKGKNPESLALFQADAFHTIRKAYKKAGLELEWQKDSQDRNKLDQIAYALSVFKDDNASRNWLVEQGVSSNIIEAVLTISTVSKFIRLSIKALDRILPYMKDGKRYDEAVVLSGYVHHSQTGSGVKTRYIPRPGEELSANPVVARALNQARKLTNAIIREYGPPSAVHIELARDLSRPLKERRRIQKEQENYRDMKATDIELFEDTFGFIPKGSQFVRWRLYREQGGQCAYSFKPIDLSRLFEDGYAEIDHALPYSRSFNDGMNNKVLARTVENRNKGNLTPFEYLDGKNESERWRTFVAWVSSNKNIRVGKRNTLLRRDFGAEAAGEFRERHLNDTRYICREFKRLVETHLELSSDNNNQRCVVVSGQLTSYLRARWGLLKVREEGDLHHALDAVVVAACSGGMVKRLSDYSRRGELEYAQRELVDPETGLIIDRPYLKQLEKHFPQPWAYFRNEVEAWLSPDPRGKLAALDNYSEANLQHIHPIRVSRAPTQRGMGAAHKETIRSAKYLDENKSTHKTSLAKLKLKDLPNMVGYQDPRNKPLIDAIETRLKEFGDDGKKAFETPLYKPRSNGDPGPVVRSVKLFNVQKSGIPVRNGVADNGDMMRADVFRKDKKYFIVPLYVADSVKELLPCKAVVANKHENDWTVIDNSYEFLFSLHPNDYVSVQAKEYEVPRAGYYSGLDRATGSISVWVHDRNRNIC